MHLFHVVTEMVHQCETEHRAISTRNEEGLGGLARGDEPRHAGSGKPGDNGVLLLNQIAGGTHVHIVVFEVLIAVVISVG